MTQPSAFAAILLVCASLLDVVAEPVTAGSTTSDIAARLASDRLAVATYREGLQNVEAFCASRPDLFPTAKVKGLRMLKREDKEALWNVWNRCLEYELALDSIRSFHMNRFMTGAKEGKRDSLQLAYAAHVAQYRFALKFIRLAENDPGLAVLLDDSVPELGLEGGTYDRFKVSFLNPVRATEFLAYKTLWTVNRAGAVDAHADEDAATILELGKWDAHVLTADNALDVLKTAGAAAWLPVQTGVSIWMGDTKVWRKDRCLITQDQVRHAAELLQPGDILLERREWFMTNVGLPGFWPHAALFIGTPDQRRAFFADSEVHAWVVAQGQADGDFEKLLESRYPAAYADSLKPQEDGHAPRILEAVGEGVIFTTLEHSAAADSLAVFRPRLSAKEKAVALLRALHYAGRPYDYNFDFATDSAIVCTELVYKSYQNGPDSRGLTFPLLNLLGRLATPANEIVRQFDATFGSPEQQFDLVLFLDGQEPQGKAVEGDLKEFRKSWRRPKWHVVVQAASAARP